MGSSTPLVESQKISYFGTILFIGNWMAEIGEKGKEIRRRAAISVLIGTRRCSPPENTLRPSSPICENRFEIESEKDFNKISSLDSNQKSI
ncbi:hypothetical protein L6452_40386 [Arctium lappa]|uniref:Uncharacterized protein n=1 Tax=Arctium lappa TaxID=4217 RepID=A0ACB8XMC1_ARCLA|nr:hypothetical protein L6452_40386 [Arctium lappa]